MTEFKEQQTPKKDNLYYLAERVIHISDQASEAGLFKLIQELKQTDPEEYLSRLIQMITESPIPDSKKKDYIKIVRES